MAPRPNYYDDDDDLSEEEVAPRKRKTKKGKDPNKPKRNMSAFFLYSQAHRSQVKEDNPDVAFGEIARILSRQYKALTPKEMKKWEKKAEQDKLRYQEEMKHYVPPDDEDDGGGKRKKKLKKDPNMPKRNMSAYFLYSVHIRPTVKEENPEATFGEIAKIISAKFKQLDEDERKEWDEKAVEDKQRYEGQMEAYKATL
uniref:HMG box domain-containing protein n=1 Tax=Grammatophora oceanica TaxID=210454 RepID=A0A7S1UZB0_9STRA|mmetsp:Transcript_30444/g.45082  ORF Transcript_30444/g.45082 Transcript_30444/m.45082 type:complete len:198 (+) Transcript_30444:232-825(+)|eukprot:CAMPEP_0194036718 /NCGR_PEP_ID=MMETSP0009_2-20130614/9084_1 /TAXON_ID=210454 /ORGANISM="Grammatophora oceanica, Strain CCMP 410" /LENGTH=197 /DNA_ID=CAMNT_0038678589 /DNA_START=152 /DNA_END=745 /DNA_ORIENTATION=+